MDRTFEVIDDFLSEKDVEYLLKMVEDHSAPDPKPHFEGTGILDQATLDKGHYPYTLDPDNFLPKIVDKVRDYYLTTHEILGEFVFSRIFGVTMLEGAVLPPHRDEDENSSGEYDGKKRSHVCSIILNDDYEGGQLLFPDQGASIKPKAGSMVFFPGYYVSHGVREVTKGTRRVLLVFFYDMLPS